MAFKPRFTPLRSINAPCCWNYFQRSLVLGDGDVTPPVVDWCIYYAVLNSEGLSGTLNVPPGEAINLSTGGFIAAATTLQGLIANGRAGIGVLNGGNFVVWVGATSEPAGWTFTNLDDFSTTPLTWNLAECTNDDFPQQLRCWSSGDVDYIATGAANWFPFIADATHLGHVEIFPAGVANGYAEANISSDYNNAIKAIFGAEASAVITVNGDTINISVLNTWIEYKHQHDLFIPDGVTQNDVILNVVVCP